MAQMVYLHLTNKPKIVTEKQLIGNDYADKIAGDSAQEKRGTIRHKDFLLFFCVDMITSNVACEIKSVFGEENDWYLRQSIVQSSLYAYLLTLVHKLDTPKFMVNKGFKYEVMNLKENPINYYLLKFGDRTFLINRNASVAYHFIRKAVWFKSCIDLEFGEAMNKSREWDTQYKFKDHIELIEKINYKEICIKNEYI